jgi:low affinity Fe/Cu permease
VTGTTIDTTTTPTYSWATAAGAMSSIAGLILLAVCIYASVTSRSAHGFAPVPAGVTALACVLVLVGVVLVLFRILHADRETLDARMDRLVERLEALDRKLNNVWGIAAVTSIESHPAHVRTDSDSDHKPKPPKQRTRRHSRRGGRAAVAGGSGDHDAVPPPSSLEVRRAARRLLDQVEGREGHEGREDKREDKI